MSKETFRFIDSIFDKAFKMSFDIFKIAVGVFIAGYFLLGIYFSRIFWLSQLK